MKTFSRKEWQAWRHSHTKKDKDRDILIQKQMRTENNLCMTNAGKHVGHSHTKINTVWDNLTNRYTRKRIFSHRQGWRHSTIKKDKDWYAGMRFVCLFVGCSDLLKQAYVLPH